MLWLGVKENPRKRKRNCESETKQLRSHENPDDPDNSHLRDPNDAERTDQGCFFCTPQSLETWKVLVPISVIG